MPTTLRVPSKGAIRVLRNLAFGTTCAAAFGVGVITEDRRRRIRSLQEAHNNALRIKAARSYHGQGTASSSSLDDGTVDGDIWLAGDPMLRKLNRETNRVVRDEGKNIIIPGSEPKPPGLLARYSPSDLLPQDEQTPSCRTYDPDDVLSDLQINRPRELRYKGSNIYPLKVSSLSIPEQHPHSVFACEWQEGRKPEPKERELPKIEIKPHIRQQRIARDVLKLLQDPENPQDVDAAATRLLEILEEGVDTHGEGLIQPLIDAAATVSEACIKHQFHIYQERILVIILLLSPLDEANCKRFGLREADYHRFSPLVIIQNLISRSGNVYSPDTPLPHLILEKASSLYLMRFRDTPQTASPLHWQVGQRLCRETCLAGLHELTMKLYHRLQIGRAERGHTPLAVDELLKAACALKKDTFDLYKTFYSQTWPDEENAINTVDQVLDSIIKTGNMEHAVEALFIADEVAQKCGFQNSTTPILKVIKHQWKTTRDISLAQELFKRLEPLVHRVHHPVAIYNIMIQCCVEAGDEDAAREHYTNYRQDLSPEQADLRIIGHFALAAAMRGDWRGAINQLTDMCQLVTSDNRGDVDRNFIPILKLFDESHTVGETETLVHDFISKHGLQLTDRLLNTMINVYAKAKEIDPMVRWIDYAASIGCQINTVSFNTILNNCRIQWNFDWPEIHSLYKKIRNLSGLTVNFTDETTLEILARCALTDGSNNENIDKRLEVLKKLGRSKDVLDGQRVYHAMATAFKEWDYEGVLEFYRMAPQHGVLLDPKHTTMAVRASLELRGRDLTEAVQIIADAVEGKRNVSVAVATLIIHQMDHFRDVSQTFDDQILSLVESALAPLEAHGVPVSQKILTHTMSHLEKRGLFRRAIDFWKSMCQRLKIRPSAIEIQTLNVLMRIYLQLRDAGGVQWVIGVLSTNSIVPDKHLLLALKNAKRVAKRVAYSTNFPVGQDFVRALNFAIAKVLHMREEAKKEKELVKEVTIRLFEKAIKDRNQRVTLIPDEKSDRAGKEKVAQVEKQKKAARERKAARSVVLRRIDRPSGTRKPCKIEWEDRPGLPPPNPERERDTVWQPVQTTL